MRAADGKIDRWRRKREKREREEVGGWMAWEEKKVISGERKRADGRRVDFWRNIVDLDDRRNCGVGESGYTKKCN